MEHILQVMSSSQMQTTREVIIPGHGLTLRFKNFKRAHPSMHFCYDHQRWRLDSMLLWRLPRYFLRVSRNISKGLENKLCGRLRRRKDKKIISKVSRNNFDSNIFSVLIISFHFVPVFRSFTKFILCFKWTNTRGTKRKEHIMIKLWVNPFESCRRLVSKKHENWLRFPSSLVCLCLTFFYLHV